MHTCNVHFHEFMMEFVRISRATPQEYENVNISRFLRAFHFLCALCCPTIFAIIHVLMESIKFFIATFFLLLLLFGFQHSERAKWLDKAYCNQNGLYCHICSTHIYFISVLSLMAVVNMIELVCFHFVTTIRSRHSFSSEIPFCTVAMCVTGAGEKFRVESKNIESSS